LRLRRRRGSVSDFASSQVHRVTNAELRQRAYHPVSKRTVTCTDVQIGWRRGSRLAKFASDVPPITRPIILRIRVIYKDAVKLDPVLIKNSISKSSHFISLTKCG
jgi:hypothetical protein